MRRYLLITPLFLFIFSQSCNMFMIAVRNVPVFFTPSEVVKNKITNPVRKDVRLTALWVGHSTLLIQIDDKVILTDPVLTETGGELGRRVVEPGIDPENIPRCDLIIISHSHFDHLSLGSLKYLEKKNKNTPLVFPNDLEYFLPDLDFELVRMKNDKGYSGGNITGETKTINGIRVTTVYAQHWGGRYGFDGYLWGSRAFTGYILEYNGLTIYFAGDTGYETEKFKLIGENFNIDLACIPIGPCADCRYCGSKNHVFPTDAVYIFKDVKAKWMVPIHYGTFVFAQAEPLEPLAELRKIMIKEKLEDKIKILMIGEQVELIKK
jgi:N-acyl-phosphatidylethanolamine-hydrolysing phospholipase D